MSDQPGITLSEALARSAALLTQAGVDNPQLDARVLICATLSIDRLALLTQGETELSAAQSAAIDVAIGRRCKREPVGRILGKREFWGLEFALNEATLEPRPDSETVIEAVLKRAESTPPARVLDLGTGTGCLLLALLHEWPQATGLGIDLSPRAIEQATANAKALGLDQRAQFRIGNWLQDVKGQFDVIVSNPPYIPSPDLPELMPEVRDFDPMQALDGGEDGLAPYRHLIPRLKDFLAPQGIVAFEFGAGQADAVNDLLAQNGYQNIERRRDLGGVTRCLIASR